MLCTLKLSLLYDNFLLKNIEVYLMKNPNDMKFTTPQLQPGSNYSVKLANSREKDFIMKIMNSENRQTMNLRLMPNAKLLLLQDKDNDNATAGWAGVDYEFNPKFPETFSLFIIPNYRSRHLSLILKHALYSILYFNRVSKAYIRMEAIQNKSLMAHNLKTGAYRLLNADEVNSSWRENCFTCELYNNSCQSQSYLEVDVIKLFNYCNNKLGAISDIIFPKSVILKNTNGHHLAQWKNAYDK